MILRRFIEHVKDQNWFAVGLDVVVVIVGIFLGMQVTEWNAARKAAALELKYLERLEADLAFNATQPGRLGKMHGDIADHLNKVASMLMNEDWDPELHEELAGPRLSHFVFPSAKLQTGTYTELLSTGRFDLIRDDLLKKLMIDASAESAWVEGQLEYFRKYSVERDSRFRGYLKPVIQDAGEAWLIQDFEPLHGNVAFASALLESTTAQRILSTYRSAEAAAWQKALDRLNCLLEKATCESLD